MPWTWDFAQGSYHAWKLACHHLRVVLICLCHCCASFLYADSFSYGEAIRSGIVLRGLCYVTFNACVIWLFIPFICIVLAHLYFLALNWSKFFVSSIQYCAKVARSCLAISKHWVWFLFNCLHSVVVHLEAGLVLKWFFFLITVQGALYRTRCCCSFAQPWPMVSCCADFACEISKLFVSYTHLIYPYKFSFYLCTGDDIIIPDGSSLNCF